MCESFRKRLPGCHAVQMFFWQSIISSAVLNISGGNNAIAPNATKIEQHIHINIELQCDFITVIAHLVFNAIKW